MKNLWTNAWKHGKTEFSGKIFKNLTSFMHFEIRNFRAHHGKVSTFYWIIYPWKIFLSIFRQKKPKVPKNLNRGVHRRNQSLDRNFHYILGLSNLNWLLDSFGCYNIFCLFSFLSNRFQCILILFDDKFGYLFHNQSTIAMSTAKRRQSFKKILSERRKKEGVRIPWKN